jgi:hypothetical protein
MRSKYLTLVLFLVLGGCTSHENLRADFGASYAINRDAQIVDPGAASRGPRTPIGDGQKMEQSLKDYRKGKPEASREQLIITTNGR